MQDDPHDPFTPHQRERLAARLQALRDNRIALRNPRTRHFPANLSTAIFAHAEQDPVSGFPRVLGYRAVDKAGGVIDAASQVIVAETEAPSQCRIFSDRLLQLWEESIRMGKGPHLFHFGARPRRVLMQWVESCGGSGRFAALLDPGGTSGTDLRRLLRTHFDLPVPGRLTLFAVARILGLFSHSREGESADALIAPPDSLFHDDPLPYVAQNMWSDDEHGRLRADSMRRIELLLDLEVEIWKWLRALVESDFEQSEWLSSLEADVNLASSYLDFLEEQRRLREEDILGLQELSLEERIERFRALGPLTFEGTALNDEGRFLYNFRIPAENAESKFREDDFLKLVPVGSRDLQSGFPVILARYSAGEEQLSVLSRTGRPALNRRLAYSLEEDSTDWTHPSLVRVVRSALEGARRRDRDVTKLLAGKLTASFAGEGERLLWLQSLQRNAAPLAALNPSQRTALELPFRKQVSLIEGPPGTGKTHLLGWIIIALMLHAQERGESLRIAVSALTHRAIDGVLRKLVELVSRCRIKDFPARVAKLGRWKAEQSTGMSCAGEPIAPLPLCIQPLHDPEEIRRSRHLVLGSTGFGLHRLLGGESGLFPQIFDWVVFDEASQILVPQALLSLVYGKGNCLFLGDVHQLPPVVLGKRTGPGEKEAAPAAAPDPNRPNGFPSSPDPARSIFAHLLERYGAEHRTMLDVSYRMNEDLCAFPSRMWYGGRLRPARDNAHSRLQLIPVSAPPEPTSNPAPSEHPPDSRQSLLDTILDPQQPVALVLADHFGSFQRSCLEADIAAQLAARLMVRYGLSPDQLAVLSPHRAHNNAVAARLRELPGMSGRTLPLIDTIERVQGAERDVILFAFTTSDPDHVTSEFINDPNRFNVAITRAKKKLIVIGSPAFFLSIPQNEAMLRRNLCFKEFLRFCRERGSLLVWSVDGV